MGDPKPTPKKETRTWLRSLRPLLWWLLLVLVLFLYHTHEQLSEKTRLRFRAEMGGRRVDYQTSATLDGVNISSGQKVKLGHHEFVVSHPKAHPFSTNLFIWYGEHDLGAIALERIRGALELQIVPPARSVSVTGGEFSAVLTNSGGITSSVPTDVYEVNAHWANYDEKRRLNVAANGVSTRLTPALGDLTIGSDPSGAAVVAQDGHTLGTTPLTLRELPVGLWKGELQLAGYIPVPIALMLTSNQTNSFSTNLVNWQYSQAMDSARKSFSAGDLDQTLQAVAAALKAQPDDSAALKLRQIATIKQHFRNAEAFVVAGDFESVRREAEAVRKIAPGDASADELSREISRRMEAKQQKEKEERYAQREKRLAAAKEAVNYAFQQHADAPLFEAHEITAAMPAREAQAAIYRELASAPAFRMKSEKIPMNDSFVVFGALEFEGGLRRCVIVGSEIETNETHIVFKVMEFRLKTVVGFQGQLTINRGYVTVDPTHPAELSEKEKQQIKQGFISLDERIQRAVGHRTP